MTIRSVSRAVGALCLFLAAGLALAADPKPTPAAEPAKKEESAGPLQNLKFRNLGPAAGGGRITAIAGIPGDPNTIYLGSCSGGVFKTVDSGLSWKAIFEKYPPSIGAITIAPSNASLVWVGTGEANPRNNVIDGHGVYFSADAGVSWRFMGLADAGQIGRIVIDPNDSNTVTVAVLGNLWKPNAERGIFRTQDGGQTWKKVLYVDDQTGASDIVMQPGNSKVLLAGMWQFRRFPWEAVGGGPGSGLWKSTDGGTTWKKLEKDMPEGPLGRISLAIAPTNGNHVYALIHSKKGILFESKDLGEHWEKLTDNRTINVRPWYFSVIAVSPADENKLYFGSFNFVTSIDGGKTFQTNNRRIHPDYHAIWIDPKDPERIIQGQDGGALMSTNGGKSWRPFENLPLGQFYQVAVSSETPYTICGGLQDNNGWCGMSNSLARGGISDADWYVVTGGDGEYVVPAPSDPNIIYADSQNGNISRFDRRTRISRSIRPYLSTASEMPPADLKYRFNWTSPIAVSATDANEVYVGGNVVFKSTDGGLHWTALSPDLTRNDKSKQKTSGGPVNYDISGAETYDTLLSLAISPVDPKVIWAGSDDGLVHVTKDGGKTWTNVSPKGAPEWGRIYQIDASPFDSGTAHLVYDMHMLGDRHPYVYRTADGGSTWTAVAKGLPEDGTAYVVRENPNKKGFLAVGTDNGLHYSADAGATWKKLSGDFPTVPVWDLKFVKASHDLVVASHGRGMYVLDNITALEELDAPIEGKALHFFTAQPAAQWQTWNRGGFGIGAWTAPNPPGGVVIDYYLKSEIKQTDEQKRQRREPVKITVVDARGNPVTTEYAPAKEGINRHVWQMRYEGPKRITFGGEPPPPNEFFDANRGPDVVPGTYKVTVSAAGETQSRDVAVGPDPRFAADPEALSARTKTALEIRNQVTAVNEILNRLDGWETQLAALPRLVGGGEDGEPGRSKKYEAAIKASRDLAKKVKELKDKMFNREIQRSTPSDTLHFHTDFQGKLSRLGFGALGAYGEAPREVVKEAIASRRQQLDGFLAQFNALVSADVPAYNKTAIQQGVPTLFAGEAVSIEPPAGF
ncbi:MAG: WD40/YVTN/BNR-like repeat-containing protein [Thermoanaerobaculia bacterium]